MQSAKWASSNDISASTKNAAFKTLHTLPPHFKCPVYQQLILISQAIELLGSGGSCTSLAMCICIPATNCPCTIPLTTQFGDPTVKGRVGLGDVVRYPLHMSGWGGPLQEWLGVGWGVLWGECLGVTSCSGTPLMFSLAVVSLSFYNIMTWR